MSGHKNHDYHIIDPSPWPLLGAVSGFIMLVGMVIFMKGGTPAVSIVGFLMVLYTMYVWWRDVIRESRAGDHTPVVSIGLRMGMILFIMSEVMFFSAWFWMFFKHAIFPTAGIPELFADGGVNLMTTAHGPDSIWPPEGIIPFDPWSLPLINTLILLLSGCTVTYAHHCLLENKRPGLLYGLMATVALGAIFTMFQAYEYTHASFSFRDNIYGATFFMATGFHGFHVLVGTIFLAVCLFRTSIGDFTAKKHIGFEAAAWYWHFVDVVWLFLFAGIYIWGR
ncbi:cytochrome c oxidase subunit 3 [Rhodobacteraceae bacterium NNCM2]|nr:cytochrome c oxidase subunit 3 [Coraliihabitans acroporae]